MVSPPLVVVVLKDRSKRVMYYTDEWKIVEIKGPINLALIKDKESGKLKFCTKQELDPFLVQEYRMEIKGEGGEQI